MRQEVKQEATRSYLYNYVGKMAGKGKNPLVVEWKDILTVFIGGTITISILMLLTNLTATSWIMAPFGASCVLAFGAWQTPYSQPRNIVGGHVISSFIALFIYTLLGDETWAIGIAVGLAILLMMLTKTTHPPAAANPIIIMLGGYQWGYLFSPVIIGSVIIVIIAVIINNLRSDRAYPTFWL